VWRRPVVPLWFDAAMPELVVVAAAVVLAAGLVLIGLGRAGARGEELRAVARRQAAIERKLDLVLGHLGVTVPEERHEEVERLLAEGRMIHAVKVYRERTGASLLDARNAVEEIARRRGLPLQ
jgi:ribosomal protein L7/L12